MTAPANEARDGPRIDLTHAGPTEADWAPVLTHLRPFAWPPADRLVVVSPHPDDETLGAGGLIATSTTAGRPVLVVSVTDGEAAFAEPGLGPRRICELNAALACLAGPAPVAQHRLALPDGSVSQHAAALEELLVARVVPGDLVACPLLDDGHPDHAATSLAATRAARRVGAAVRWFPIWAWHCHDPRWSPIRHGQRLDLDPTARRRKQAATSCYPSQTAGPEPIVPPAMLIRLDRPFEVFIEPIDNAGRP